MDGLSRLQIAAAAIAIDHINNTTRIPMTWRSFTSGISDMTDAAGAALQNLRDKTDAVIRQNVLVQLGLPNAAVPKSARPAPPADARSAGLRGPIDPTSHGRAPPRGQPYRDSRDEMVRGDWDAGMLQWPVPDHNGLNPRNTGIGQGSGEFGTPRRRTDGSRGSHQGIDITAPEGTQIFSAGKGRVVGRGMSNTYGLYVDVDHGDGVMTRYAHLSDAGVRPGDAVDRGQPIAVSGRSGNVPGAAQPHLHFEVRKNGKVQNPYGYLGPSAYASEPNADELQRIWRD